MKISKRKLKKIVEGYLFEQDEFAEGESSIREDDLRDWVAANNIVNIDHQNLHKLISDPDAFLFFSTPSTVDVGVSTLKFMSNDGRLLASFDAVSGHKDYFGTDPLDTMATKGYPEKGIKGGPTPEGSYKLGDYEKLGGGLTKTMKLAVFFGLKDESRLGSHDMDTEARMVGWGNFRYKLIPSGANTMFARSGLYIHGGKFPGSAGCIDLTDQMDEFSKIYEFWKTYTGKETIELIVDYPPIGEFKDYTDDKFGQTTLRQDQTDNAN